MRDHCNLAFVREIILRHWSGGLVWFVLLLLLGTLIQIPGPGLSPLPSSTRSANPAQVLRFEARDQSGFYGRKLPPLSPWAVLGLGSAGVPIEVPEMLPVVPVVNASRA